MTALLAAICTSNLPLTAAIDKAENPVRFGLAYAEYMHRTRPFMPFLF
jgi:hypothetical protein